MIAGRRDPTGSCVSALENARADLQREVLGLTPKGVAPPPTVPTGNSD